MGYRVELFGISDFLPVHTYITQILIALDKDYSDIGPVKGLYLKSTRSSLDRSSDRNVCEFANFLHIAGNKQVAQDVSVMGFFGFQICKRWVD